MGGGRYRQSHSRMRSPSLSSDSDSEHSDSSDSDADQDESVTETAYTKDQRTVLVSQLMMRSTEKEIRRYFRTKVGCRVIEVKLLRDKRTGNPKGLAYVEMSCMADVNKAIAVAGQPPDFQRFPILVKASQAEKNSSIPASSSTVTAAMMGQGATEELKGGECQEVYVGSLDHSVNESHLFQLFSQFGRLKKATIQMNPTTQRTRGFAFLYFQNPEDANLAIKVMQNQVLAGRPMKMGWGNKSSTIQGAVLRTSEKFPENARERAQKAFSVLSQLNGSSITDNEISTAASQALSAAMGNSSEPSGGDVPVAKEGVALPKPITTLPPTKLRSDADNAEPTRLILIHNMFDKDNETEAGWEEELKEEIIEECSKFGDVISLSVMSKEAGGKILALFGTVEGAKNCATNLQGRWFDRRQLRIDYLDESNAISN